MEDVYDRFSGGPLHTASLSARIQLQARLNCTLRDSFIVDRKTFVPNTSKNLPELVRTSTSYKSGTLKAYIARFDVIQNHLIKSNDPKVVIHLLLAYQPLPEDWLTLRHGLYTIYELVTTGDVY